MASEGRDAQPGQGDADHDAPIAIAVARERGQAFGGADDAPLRAALVDRGRASGPLSLGRVVLDTLSSPTLLTGLYAWGVSLTPTILLGTRALFLTEKPVVPARSLVLALLALPVLISSAALRNIRFPAARALGVWGFLGLCTASFLTGPAPIEAARIDAIRGVLASLGFGLYALSWGTPYSFHKPPPEAHPRADATRGYDPRGRLPAMAIPIAGAGIVASACLLALAFRPSDGPRALAAHTVAGIASVLLVTASAEIAVSRGGYAEAAPGKRANRAARGLVFLVFFVFLGVLNVVLNR
jgi:hypothetical protein